MPESLISQIVYDDAVYHQGAPVFLTERLSVENGGTHIGIYLAWIIVSKLESFSIRKTAAVEVEQVRSKQMTGREFLFAHCGGQLTSGLLNQEGQAFTQAYYENDYLRDYDQVLVSRVAGTYLVLDSWANFERLAVVMNQRLSDYRGRR